MRSGAPMRTKEISPSFFPPSASRDRRSTRLSTAAFDGAHARTLWPDKTARRMISTTTLVLPVPGGPWIQHTGAAPHSAARTASACASSNEDGSGPPPPSAMGRTSSGGRSSNPNSRIGFPLPLPFVAFTNASATSGEVEKCPGTNAATPPISSSSISSSLISFSSAAVSAGGHRAEAKSARTMSAEGGFVRLVGTFRNVLSAAICLSYVVASGTRTRRTRRPPSVRSRLIRAAFLSVSPSDLLSVGFFVAPSFFAAEASSRVSTPFAGSISEITASASLRDQGASSTSQLTETKPESSSPPSQSSTRTAATRSPTAKALGGSAPPPSTRRFSSLPPFTGLGRAEVSRKPSIIAPARPTIVPSGTSRSTADADASSFASDCDIAAAAAASASLSASSAAVATSTYRAMSPWSALLDRRRHPPSSSKPARSPFGGSLFARGFGFGFGFGFGVVGETFSPPFFSRELLDPSREPLRLCFRLRPSPLFDSFRSDISEEAPDARSLVDDSPRRSPFVRAAAPRTASGAATAAPSSEAPGWPDSRSPRAPARTTSPRRDAIDSEAWRAPAHTAPARSARAGRNARGAPRATHPTGAARVTRWALATHSG